MALMKCPDCPNSVSSTALTCPDCGCNVQAYLKQETIKKQKRFRAKFIFLLLIGLVIWGIIASNSKLEVHNENQESIELFDDYSSNESEDIEKENVTETTDENNDDLIENENEIPLDEYRMQNIPFETLFTVKGYFNFINKFWINDIRRELSESENCAEEEPMFCSMWDIEINSLNSEFMIIQLSDVCYPRRARACEPSLKKKVHYNDFEDYLNQFGKELFLNLRDYGSDYLLAYKETLKKRDLRHKIYLFGAIDNKYPFSMGLYIDDNGNAEGYYYYDNKQVWIDLKGELSENKLILNEFHKFKKTGSFTFNFPRNSLYDLSTYSDFTYILDDIKGIWYNQDNSKRLDIRISNIISNKGRVNKILQDDL